MEGILKPVEGERRRIHPHKFALWLAMGSIAMMFAGLTSAYIVRMAQGAWRIFRMPTAFWVSTGVILLSSVTMALGVRAFKARRMRQYRSLILATLLLGILFAVLQFYGFYLLYHTPQTLIMEDGKAVMQTVRVNGNPAESFLFIIFGIHGLHILGGIVALLFVFLREVMLKRVKVYNATGLEVVAGYWHFVDVLWIYLFLFFLLNQ